MAKNRKLQFNWRLMLVQVVANALALGLTALLLPGIHFHPQRFFLSLLASGFIFGLLNAFIRPVLQFIMFRFLFITFGLVLIVINFLMLWLLARLTPGWFTSESILWTLIAAILVGLLGVVFETLLGLRPPLRDDRPEAHTTDRWFSLSGAPVHIPVYEPAVAAEAAATVAVDEAAASSAVPQDQEELS
jgi:putative membrane protein